MEILFLTQVLPFPLDAGPKFRSYYTIRHLAGKNSITLLSFIRDTDTAEAIDHLDQYCKRVVTVPIRRSLVRDGFSLINSFFSHESFLIARDQYPAMDRALIDLVQRSNFQVIHSDQLWMAPYALKAKIAAEQCGYCPKLILDEHNAVYLIPKRMAEQTGNPLMKRWLDGESASIARFEQSVCRQFDHVVWVTHEDQAAYFSLAATNPMATTSNPGQNTSRAEKTSVIPICIAPDPTIVGRDIPRTQNVLFVGGMHWPPNADGVNWFIEAILPGIRKQIPNMRFVAVGRLPSTGIHTGDPKVILPGYVPDLDEYWSSSRVFIVPLRSGGGMRVKILDAWMKGIPVVSTTIGAEGISYTPGKDILIADDPVEFSQAVIRIITDDQLAQSLKVNSWNTLSKHYSWVEGYLEWDRVYAAVTGNQSLNDEKAEI